MPTPWHPILPSALALRAADAVQAILQSIPSPDRVEWGASLGGGHAGFALLSGYAALAEPGPRRLGYVDSATAHLETAAGLLADGHGSPGLIAGYTGVAWVVDHLQQRGLLVETEDLNEAIDEALLSCLSREPWPGLPELLEGLAGMGLYALDQQARGRSRQVVERVLCCLQAAVETTPQGTAWFDSPERLPPLPRQRHPEGAFNLGVAHGNPGVIGFLAEAWHCGYAQARPLLDTSMAWLLAQKSPHPDGSLFGRAFGRGDPSNPDGSRLAWCYGDLGIAAVLLMTGARAKQRSWQDEAIRLALACAERPDPWRGLMDPGMCHGAAGNGHLFARLYHGTGNPRFKEMAIQFHGRALDMRTDSFEGGGFLAYAPAMPEEPARNDQVALPGLLEGATGIGLSLLAATTAVEPSWDRHLLVHVPPGSACVTAF